MKYDTSFWVQSIADATTDTAKDILSGDEPPTLEQLRTLDTVHNDMHTPGVYFGLVNDILDTDANFTCTGSDTRAGRGIGGRTGQHLILEYREKELE